MPRLGRVSNTARLRARRWDVIVLGSGLAALVAAARLGAANQRVLVVEEDAARAQHPALREPFLLSGWRDQGVLDLTLRTLGIPLIDQRRIQSERLAYQVVSPKWRVDVGTAPLTTTELSAWGLCESAVANSLVRSLGEAADAERRAMLEADVVRTGRRLGLARGSGSHLRGLPGEAVELTGELKQFFDAQVSALSNLASAQVHGEARARLLGVPLAGGSGFGDEPPWLLGLLRQRVETLHGEFRSLAGDFVLVAADGQPGIQVAESEELWLARSLVIGAAPSAIAKVLGPEKTPDFLAPKRAACRRVGLHLRVDKDSIPRGMGPRVIIPGPDVSGDPGAQVTSLTAFACAEEPDRVDLVARMRAEAGSDPAETEDQLESLIRDLMPFSGDRLERRTQRRPQWDDDGWLEDPLPGTGWPVTLDLRASSRPPVYRLDRASLASLGLEGDLLLGWRAGDLIAREMT